ncbi:hypothetical protein BW716_13485 [[Flexibacter] sp. ATCC 35208]|nr:hypothetical protein BW716_13485 [[Flexibacter] sp. ATCC 35208]
MYGDVIGEAKVRINYLMGFAIGFVVGFAIDFAMDLVVGFPLTKKSLLSSSEAIFSRRLICITFGQPDKLLKDSVYLL